MGPPAGGAALPDADGVGAVAGGSVAGAALAVGAGDAAGTAAGSPDAGEPPVWGAHDRRQAEAAQASRLIVPSP